MFIALDKLHNQGLKQAIIVVPEKAIGASFNDEPLDQVRLLGRLARGAKMESLQRARRGQWRQGQFGRRVSRERRQGAGLHPRDLPLRRRQVRRRDVRRPADRRGRVPPRLGQPRQQARPASRPVHRPRPGAYRRDDRLLLPGRRRSRAGPAGRGEVRYRHLHLLRAAQRLRISEAARHRLFLLFRLLCRRHPEGARPGREDDHPHPERQFAREHEGQDQGSRAHHRGTGRVARDRPRDRLPARQDARRPRSADRRPGR